MGAQETELEKLRRMVTWMEDQFQGHEDNFAMQFNRIHQLEAELEKAKADVQNSAKIAFSAEVKYDGLAQYVALIDKAPILKALKAENRNEWRRDALVTAYRANVYKHTLETMLHTLYERGTGAASKDLTDFIGRLVTVIETSVSEIETKEKELIKPFS